MADVTFHKHSSHLMEQICTIGVCGALGAIVISMWAIPNGLNFLGPQFQAPLGKSWLSPLFWGGVIVVAMVLVRALAVWTTVGQPAMAPHSHDQEHASCDHEHAHCGQDHGHEHGWAPWRYVVMLLPVGLYSLGLVPTALSSHTPIDIAFDDTGPSASARDGELIQGFLELDRAAATASSRKKYEGRTAQVSGQVTNAGTKRFGLVRYKVGCCVPDAIALNLRVVVLQTTREGKLFDATPLATGKKWVEVSGVIQFRKLNNSEEYVTVLEAQGEDVRVLAKPPANPFVY